MTSALADSVERANAALVKAREAAAREAAVVEELCAAKVSSFHFAR
jgi:hypothetical protein